MTDKKEAATDELATVASFSNTAEAGLAKERLENEGIRALVTEGMTGGVMSYIVASTGGVHVQVAQENLEQAREVLGLDDPDEIPTKA